MSPLTKALVLLVTILSIVLVALVVPFVANTDDLNEEISSLKTQVQVANAAASRVGGENETLKAKLAQSDSSKDDTIIALRTEVTEKTQEKATLEAQLKEATSQVDKHVNTISLMSATQDQLTQLLEDRNALVSTSQSENVKLKKEAAQLVQANNDLAAQVTGLTRTVRLQGEKIVDLQEQLAGGGSSSDVAAGPGFLEEQVQASVTGLEKVDEITFASLNVGSNDSISPNTKFVIFRNGDQYVGTATVMSVDETVSVARIDSSTLDVVVGDNAMTGITY
ncbi:hypothetical protein [Algisphaera agarilytica]|uniref:Regulator of replication initiation timing n=1 Tax=Algisphaera agarilytica TaxID=1385975 RepID=A0A7X0H970_9BACT|nr:hypothetical protein [Algisphaera agarilytica]MBB6431407.1 regulator of replication initiation timing [Algisphaera agarilytica]